MSLRILQITPHMGGGAGVVIKKWVDSDKENVHKVTYLNDIPENKDKGYELFDPIIMDDYDIIVCHVWNHPSFFSFLTKTKITGRLIGWSHINGLYPPNILFDKLISYFDDFYFTSPASKNTGIEKDYIWSVCDIDKFLEVERKEHKGFNIGYIGTIDFSKMSPDFIEICSRVNIPDAKFIVVGGGCDLETVKQQAKDKGIYDKFIFTGYDYNIIPYLEQIDVFLYPLYEKHFGTCEQILGEVMAAGIPIIVMGNEPEKHIIEHKKNGIICNTINSTIKSINGIYSGKIKLKPEKIKELAKERYCITNFLDKWNKVFDNIMKRDKKYHSWQGFDSPFIESLGNYGEVFKLYKFAKTGIEKLFAENNQWKSKTKGSIKHYLDYFEDDEYLKEWIDLL